MKTRSLITLVVGCVGLLGSGCTTVTESPSSAPVSGEPLLRGVEPEPAPIPTKDIPAGQSSLRHTQPD